ncbi:hypothetical protein GA0115253_100491, partial [Streptomyces sp. Termitarium-T10T-6]
MSEHRRKTPQPQGWRACRGQTSRPAVDRTPSSPVTQGHFRITFRIAVRVVR